MIANKETEAKQETLLHEERQLKVIVPLKQKCMLKKIEKKTIEIKKFDKVS